MARVKKVMRIDDDVRSQVVSTVNRRACEDPSIRSILPDDKLGCPSTSGCSIGDVHSRDHSPSLATS